MTSKVRALEGRYLGKLGFELIGRYGWRGENSQWFEPGTSWEALDEMGFRLRLVELARGAVNVVLQPGHWELPRVDHLGIALDEGEYDTVIDRADELGLKIQDHPGKRTFVTTEAVTKPGQSTASSARVMMKTITHTSTKTISSPFKVGTGGIP